MDKSISVKFRTSGNCSVNWNRCKGKFYFDQKVECAWDDVLESFLGASKAPLYSRLQWELLTSKLDKTPWTLQ